MTKQEAVYLFEQKVPNRIPVIAAPSGSDWYIYSANTLGEDIPINGVVDAGLYKVSDEGVEFVSVKHMPKDLGFQGIKR